MTHDAVREALAELARELAPLLPERAAAIGEAFARARERPGDCEALDTLRMLVHRMRGTAGSHGFSELSVEAGFIEDAIEPGIAVAEATWASMATHVENIRAAAARAARDASKEAP